MPPTLRLIRPSSREQNDLLGPRLEELRAAGFRVLYDEVASDLSWTYTAGAAPARAASLMSALLEPESQVILAARGGYGASDLLPLLDWPALAAARPKLLVGFSDISALHSALYAKLGWPSMHGPMPATALWRKNGVAADVEALLANIRQFCATPTEQSRIQAAPSAALSGMLPLIPILRGGGTPNRRQKSVWRGRLFGGCFTVLTNLIGTPYFPRSLAGHIVFIEDTDEHPGRLMRAFNQWLQSGILDGVQALVLGHLRHLGDKIPDSAGFVLAQFAARAPAELAVFHSPHFGHVSPNFPLVIGAEAVLELNAALATADSGRTPATSSDAQLRWQLQMAPGAVSS